MKKETLMAALACQAVGDALGDKFEFRHNIKMHDVQTHIMDSSKESITDDTQMTYFGMRALTTVLKENSQDSEARCLPILLEYLEWFRTQQGGLALATNPSTPKELYRIRCPGTATMRSLEQLERTSKRDKNNSRGCGSVMKLLPFMLGYLPDKIALSMAVYSGLVTHDHPESSAAVQRLFSIGRQLERAGLHGLSALIDDYPEVYDALDIKSLGSGFYAMECVNMALWAVMHSDTYEELLLQSIAHDGDSDSVAAVAGCLWGLLMKEMPDQKLLNRVVEWPVLQEQAELLWMANLASVA